MRGEDGVEGVGLVPVLSGGTCATSPRASATWQPLAGEHGQVLFTSVDCLDFPLCNIFSTMESGILTLPGMQCRNHHLPIMIFVFKSSLTWLHNPVVAI